MQVSLDIQDDLYKKIVSSGIDMQSKFNEYLSAIISKKQFQEDKAYFTQALYDVENYHDNLVDTNEYNEEMNEFEKSL
jgi:hypothetical protein